MLAPASESLPAPIAASWKRCLASGLDPGGTPEIRIAPASELRARREQAETVRRLAQAELETLTKQIAGSNFLLAFADREGVILDLYADNRFAMSGSGAGIVPGARWDEAQAGTNGLGTALRLGQPVAVSGPEHFFHSLGAISCTAAPVRDTRGEIVGVLDASSYHESRQRHTLALVQMAATHIENGLLQQQMAHELVVAVHPRAEFLGTLSSGLLAFDGDGRLLCANARARQLLTGLRTDCGSRFEALFDERLETALARMARHGQAQLRDRMGSALSARLLGSPAWPAQASWPASPLPPAVPSSRAGSPSKGPAAAAAHPAQDGAQDASGPEFIADDPAVEAACRTARRAVRLAAPVLIHGETGTGKEVLARHAHRCSGRRGGFVGVNCAALPAEIVEAELFGYAGGAFTGARREGSTGLIAAADGGTLLLDEIGELPLAMQAKLLRFLDDRTVRPVGAPTGRTVDVQILAASHVDLHAAVAAGRFRADLLYRLAVVEVRLPPLRRRGDLAAAVALTLRRLDPQATLEPEALQRLCAHAWPGNFRELRTVLTRALLDATGDGCHPQDTRLRVHHVEPHLAAQPPAGVPPGPAAARHGAVALRTADAGDGLRRLTREAVVDTFERAGRNVARTSRRLGISRTTVYRHLREAGWSPEPCDPIAN
ncbi:MAG: hypothetical protein RI988_657 [Pseudomonadota bacterium]|jgi:transcriptional regulator of acetoin/glycerol metabolism